MERRQYRLSDFKALPTRPRKIYDRHATAAHFHRTTAGYVMRISFAIAAIAFGVATMASSYAAHAADCSKAEGGQAGLNDCAGNNYKKSDAELNTLYKKIETRLQHDADATKRLVAAQRAWVAYRDAECRFQSSKVADGSVHPMIVLMCLDTLTRRRIAHFRSYLHCNEGDLSCPVPAAD